MSVHDTIGDFITVIRNADRLARRPAPIRIPICERLGLDPQRQGFVLDCTESQSENGINSEVQLKYVDGEHAIRGINRISTPGRRSYCGYRDIPHVLGGLGVSILSTPQGIVDDKTARKNKLGGELLCSVW